MFQYLFDFLTNFFFFFTDVYNFQNSSMFMEKNKLNEDNRNNGLDEFYKNLNYNSEPLNLIPPPRSFSDNNDTIQTSITTQTTSSTKTNLTSSFNVNSLHNSMESNNSYLPDKLDFDDSGDSNFSPPNNKGTIQVCIIKNPAENDGEFTLSTAVEVIEEVPTKIPQLNAMPKKSAMKKRRVDNQSNNSTSNSTNSTINRFSSNNNSLKQQQQKYKVIVPELKSVIKGLKSNQNSVNLQCKRITIEKEKNPSVVSNSDSDSDDGDSLAKLRDYYGDDEEGSIAAKIARRDSLEIKFSQRPDKQELIERNILPSLSDQERQKVREVLESKLSRRLRLRPTAEGSKNLKT